MNLKRRKTLRRMLAILLAAITSLSLLLPATAVGAEEVEAEQPDISVVEPEKPAEANDAAATNGSDEAAPVTLPQVFLEYYVLINRQWERIAVQYSAAKEDGDKGRFYTTPENLETIYEKFGFHAADFSGELFFAHTDTENLDTLWLDAAPYQTDGQWRIPLSFRNRCFVYYLPHNLPGSSAYCNSSVPRTDDALLAANTFYSISVSDPSGTETAATGIHHVLTGDPYTLTLAKPENRTWEITDLLTGVPVRADEVKEEEASVTLTFRAVTCPLKITAVSEEPAQYVIRYHAATLADSLEQLGYISASQQELIADGTIQGAASLDETLGPNRISEYRILQPDLLSLRVSVIGSTKNKKYDYTFRGWQVGNSADILSPNQQLDEIELKRYEINGIVTLNAVWSALDCNNRITSANFYVNIHCEIADNKSDGFQEIAESNFTKSLYTATLNGTSGIAPSGNLDYQLLAPPDSESTAYETDEILRSMTKQPYSGVMLGDFPSDEDILRALRNGGYEIELDGVRIPTEEMTTEHFKMRWYVVKYNHSDGWHIDGVLVAKEGHLRVEKTFLGDAQAIAQITAPENNYYIAVTHDDSAANRTVEDYRLSLVPSAEEAREGYSGYSSFDPETNTYVWLIEGHPLTYYTMREWNYTPQGNWHTTSRYMISNSEEVTEGWAEYTAAGVTTQIQSYPTDLPSTSYQKVSFRNTYVQTGTLTLYKMDAFTSNGLSDVSFVLRAAGDSEAPLKLYRKPGTSEYSSDAHSAGYTQSVDDGIITTDANGNVYLKLPAGSYVLCETMPTGYGGAAKLEFRLNSRGEVTALTAYTAQGNEIADLDNIANGLNSTRLTVINRSHLLTSVKVEAEWGTTPQSQQAEITVELYCDGQKLAGSVYTQKLNVNNGWSHVWENLPLFINGRIAQYTLRETMIGDTAYDPSADTDGYRNYTVTADTARYRESADGPYMDEATWVDAQGVRHYSNHALLRLHNRLDQGHVSAFVSKRWEDAANQDGLRPDSVTVQLWMDGENTGKTLTLNVNNEWSGVFEGLRKYENGREIEYTIKEIPVDGYESEITGDSAVGFLIVNTHTPAMTEVHVEKTWVGDTPAQRPQSIVVHLLADGERVATQRISADENGTWEYTFKSLPVNRNGKKIVYSVSEETVDGYTATVNGFHITNTYTAKPDPTTPKPEPTEPGDKPTEPAGKPTEPDSKPTEPVEPDTEPTQPQPTGPKEPQDSPKTADNIMVVLWAWLVPISMVCFAVLVLIRKRMIRN